MKRLIVVLGLVGIILSVGILSIFQLREITEYMEIELENLALITENENSEVLQKKTAEFQKLWEDKEQVMMHYIHHDELDTITGTVARLKALARYENYSELAAEIDRLRHLIRHIYESETPSWESIF